MDLLGNLDEIGKEWETLKANRFEPKLLADFKLKYKGKIIVTTAPFACPEGEVYVYLRIKGMKGKPIFRVCFPADEWNENKLVANEIIKQRAR